MTEAMEYKGRCLCGAVHLTVAVTSHHVSACHCNMCRTWAGAPALAIESSDDVRLEGEDHITVFDSSEWAERAFCRRCGTHVFYRLKEGGHYSIPVGLLEDQTPWVLDQQIFIDEKPAYYAFANDTKTMTGAEVFALYAPPKT